MHKRTTFISLLLLISCLCMGCSSKASTSAEPAVTSLAVEEETTQAETTKSTAEEVSSQDETYAPCELEDGTYTARFKSDSSMFHVNEACDGRGTLVVENGQMTIHISMPSKKIEYLYYGLKADAINDEDHWIHPTIDTVTYSDGMSEEVYGFDIPVPAIDQKFDCALIGTHDNWYDHKVRVYEVEPLTE